MRKNVQGKALKSAAARSLGKLGSPVRFTGRLLHRQGSPHPEAVGLLNCIFVQSLPSDRPDPDMAVASQGCRLSPYARRRPENTVLNRLVQQHLETYLALAREEDWGGHAVAAFVERELRRYLGVRHLRPWLRPWLRPSAVRGVRRPSRTSSSGVSDSPTSPRSCAP